MKCLFIIGILCLASLKLAKGNQILEAFDVCGKEANIPEDTKLNIDDATYLCIVKCVYMKVGVHDADGKLVIPELEKILNRKFTAEQTSEINVCEKKYRNTNVCKMVAQTQNCIAKIFNNLQ